MKKIIVFILLFLCFSNLLSQEKSDTVLTIDDLYIDFAIPDLSAFTMLGIKPESVSKPGDVKDFSAQILSIFSSGTKVTPGLAIEWAPFITFQKTTVDTTTTSSFQLYKDSKLYRNIQVTFGSLQDTLGSKIGLGLKWTPIENSDPLSSSDLHDAIIKIQENYYNTDPSNAEQRNAFRVLLGDFVKSISHKFDNTKSDYLLQNIRDSLFFPGEEGYKKSSYNVLSSDIASLLNATLNIDIDTTEFNFQLNTILLNYAKIIERYENSNLQSFNKKIDSLLTKFKEKNWNNSVLQFGSGVIANSEDYTWKGMKLEKVSSYLNAAFKLGDKGQFLLQGVYNLSINPDKFKLKNQYSLGGRVILGSSDKRFSIESMYTRSNYKDTVEQKNLRLTVGLEFKLSEGYWLEFAIGADKPYDSFLNEPNFVSLFNFKYTINKNRRFGK